MTPSKAGTFSIQCTWSKRNSLKSSGRMELHFRLFAPYIERQKRIDAENEQLRQMGLKMGGNPKRSTYAHIETHIGDLGLLTNDWFLRIETAAEDFTDLKLASYPDNIADCLFTACKLVPKFKAVLHRPHTDAEVIFSHA